MSTETTMLANSQTRWPWRIKVTRADGTVVEHDYEETFAGRHVSELARHLSAKTGAVRVELTTTFVNGEQVSPAADNTPLTLAERITAVLVAAGFTQYSHANGLTDPAFVVSEGVGAIVSVAWVGATDADRSLMVTRYADVLSAAGLPSENRGDHLYVAADGEMAGHGLLAPEGER